MDISTAETGLTLLIADDDEPFRNRLARAFRSRGYEVSAAANVAEALAFARAESPELAIVDLRMPDGGGLDLVRELKANDPLTNIVVLTGYGSIATAIEAVRLGAKHYLTKPADIEEIIAAFSRVGNGTSGPAGEVPPVTSSVPSLARVEWEHINRVLADCGGNVSQAARLLGIHRRSLQRKLVKFPVQK